MEKYCVLVVMTNHFNYCDKNCYKRRHKHANISYEIGIRNMLLN